jgi:membrane-anchored protein YejM (alkaline phosphatase superfamily)
MASIARVCLNSFLYYLFVLAGLFFFSSYKLLNIFFFILFGSPFFSGLAWVIYFFKRTFYISVSGVTWLSFLHFFLIHLMIKIKAETSQTTSSSKIPKTMKKSEI